MNCRFGNSIYLNEAVSLFVSIFVTRRFHGFAKVWTQRPIVVFETIITGQTKGEKNED